MKIKKFTTCTGICDGWSPANHGASLALQQEFCAHHSHDLSEHCV